MSAASVINSLTTEISSLSKCFNLSKSYICWTLTWSTASVPTVGRSASVVNLIPTKGSMNSWAEQSAGFRMVPISVNLLIFGLKGSVILPHNSRSISTKVLGSIFISTPFPRLREFSLSSKSSWIRWSERNRLSHPDFSQRRVL